MPCASAFLAEKRIYPLTGRILTFTVHIFSATGRILTLTGRNSANPIKKPAKMAGFRLSS